ncbi:NAD(P)-dependent oxidoreductase [Halopelagius fulvigenes]|uniref:NAD(P)-dependent oxidoreductase n=1 Tax=Halopelagius fulvigenes TaxID=1198324 RepID=A0ABD5U2L2_9EURY
MTSAIVVHPLYEDVWPCAADYLRKLWKKEDEPVEFIHLSEDDERPLGEVLEGEDLTELTRIVSLGVPVTDECLDVLEAVEEAAVMTDNMYEMDSEVSNLLEERGVTTYTHQSEGFWSQSVAELGLGLTIGALRQIPQKHTSITNSQDDWDVELLENDAPGAQGHQYVNNPPTHVHGTIAGKNVRIVGVGNIGSRFADYTDNFGADVAAYDPYADQPCFHRTGARQVYRMDELIEDADIFAPMVPLTDSTRRLVTRDHIERLPTGSLLLLVTRAGICDMDAVRERVLNGEIALAADVFDVEPLPLDDPLLGRDNVVHTPHVAGRTRHANEKWAEDLASQFRDRS